MRLNISFLKSSSFRFVSNFIEILTAISFTSYITSKFESLSIPLVFKSSLSGKSLPNNTHSLLCKNTWIEAQCCDLILHRVISESLVMYYKSNYSLTIKHSKVNNLELCGKCELSSSSINALSSDLYNTRIFNTTIESSSVLLEKVVLENTTIKGCDSLIFRMTSNYKLNNVLIEGYRSVILPQLIESSLKVASVKELSILTIYTDKSPIVGSVETLCLYGSDLSIKTFLNDNKNLTFDSLKTGSAYEFIDKHKELLTHFSHLV